MATDAGDEWPAGWQPAVAGMEDLYGRRLTRGGLGVTVRRVSPRKFEWAAQWWDRTFAEGIAEEPAAAAACRLALRAVGQAAGNLWADAGAALAEGHQCN